MKARAVFLVSGGLDSILAAAIMKKQAVEGVCLYFRNPFAAGLRASDIAKNAADKLGYLFRRADFGDDFLRIVENPKHGYGKNMNPCIDCRIYQFKKALEIMRQEGADFIVTGEVIGQRPMSQRRETMNLIDRESGAEGLVLRPLSARLLEPTVPEKTGLVDRNTLLDISGRSRRRQLELAAELGIEKFESPAGGCRLTMKEYSEKLRDLIENSGKADESEIKLLNIGRHFRIGPCFKVIAGRNKAENELLESTAPDESIKLKPADKKGPLCIGSGRVSDENIFLMARICGRYTDAGGDEEIKFIYYNCKGRGGLSARAFSSREVENYRI